VLTLTPYIKKLFTLQTFVPYPDLNAISSVLDIKRLGKQRVETYQIISTLKALQQPSKTIGWAKHPAVLMWKGHEGFLSIYGLEMCRKWISLGYQDTMMERFLDMSFHDYTPPSWWGYEPIHQSHRSKLIQKNPLHYAPLFPEDQAGLEYIWGHHV